ncbi:MAG: hypothetical protein ORN85_06590, partial [Sediminibacterium sp.]|nr:hypothetical protein [Sediminibacterium sp.]
ISKNNFLNQKGKQIQSNSTATNSDFINLLKTTDPIVQVYFYERDKSKGINGVIVKPIVINDNITKQCLLVKKDGSLSTINRFIEPKENYLVISTNERSGPEWQKAIAEYQEQKKEIANIRPKLVPKTNTDGTSRVCLSNPIDGKNGSVIINSSQDFTLLSKNGHNSFETYNITNNLQNDVDKNNEDKYAVMYIDDDGCIVDEPNPYNPPTTTTPTLPLNPDDYPSKIQTFTSAKFPDMGVVREFVPIDEGAPDVLLYFLTLVNPTTLNDYSSGYLSVTTDGNDVYYLQSVLYVPLFGGWWHSGDGLDFVSLYVNWRDFNPPFSYEFFLPNSTIKKRLPWNPKITGWYRGLIAVEIDANGPTFKDATFKIKPKNKDYYISFQAHNILYKYSTDLIISNGIFDIREGSKTQANPKDMNKDCTETYRNVKMNFAYNLSD